MTDDSYAPQPRSGGRGVAWSLVLLLGGFAGGLIANPWFESQVRSRLPAWAGGITADQSRPATLDTAKLTALEARIAAAEERPGAAGLPADVAARIAALEANRTVEGAGAAALASDLGPLGQRMGAVEDRLKVLEPAVQTATTAAAQIGASEARISALQSALAEQSARLRAFASLPLLRRALTSGTSASAYVDAVATALPAGSGDVALLRAAIARPVTLAGLQRSYAQVQAVVEAPAGQAQTRSTASWLDTAMEQAKTLMGQSRGGTGSAASDAIARGAAAIRRGDVEAAISAVRSANGTEQQRFSDWLVQAERFVGARAALSRIETTLALAAPAPVTPPGTLPPVPNGAL